MNLNSRKVKCSGELRVCWQLKPEEDVTGFYSGAEQGNLLCSLFFPGASAFLWLLPNSSQPIQLLLLGSQTPVIKEGEGSPVFAGDQDANPLSMPQTQTWSQWEHYYGQTLKSCFLISNNQGSLPFSPFFSAGVLLSDQLCLLLLFFYVALGLFLSTTPGTVGGHGLHKTEQHRGTLGSSLQGQHKFLLAFLTLNHSKKK